MRSVKKCLDRVSDGFVGWSEMKIEWKWYWKENEQGEADCGVIWEVRPGVCYSICRAPRYEKKNMWEINGPLLAASPNLLSAAKSALRALVRARESGDSGNYDEQPEEIELREAINQAEGKVKTDVR